MGRGAGFAAAGTGAGAEPGSGAAAPVASASRAMTRWSASQRSAGESPGSGWVRALASVWWGGQPCWWWVSSMTATRAGQVGAVAQSSIASPGEMLGEGGLEVADPVRQQGSGELGLVEGGGAEVGDQAPPQGGRGLLVGQWAPFELAGQEGGEVGAAAFQADQALAQDSAQGSSRTTSGRAVYQARWVTG